MRKVSRLGLILVLIVGLMVGSVACNNGKNELRVGTALSFPPYEYEDDGQVVGIDVDIMQEIARRMGRTYVLENMEFDDLFPALDYHKIDVIAAGLTITETRKETINFTVSYASGEQKILIKKDTNIDNIDELGKNNILIGIEKGTTGHVLAENIFNSSQLREYDDATKMMDALESNIVSAVVIDIAPAETYANSHSDLKILDIDSDYEEYALGLAKDSEYYEQVNSILQEMIEDGTVDSIIKKYTTLD